MTAAAALSINAVVNRDNPYLLVKEEKPSSAKNPVVVFSKSCKGAEGAGNWMDLAAAIGRTAAAIFPEVALPAEIVTGIATGAKAWNSVTGPFSKLKVFFSGSQIKAAWNNEITKKAPVVLRAAAQAEPIAAAPVAPSADALAAAPAVSPADDSAAPIAAAPAVSPADNRVYHMKASVAERVLVGSKPVAKFFDFTKSTNSALLTLQAQSLISLSSSVATTALGHLVSSLAIFSSAYSIFENSVLLHEARKIINNPDATAQAIKDATIKRNAAILNLIINITHLALGILGVVCLATGFICPPIVFISLGLFTSAMTLGTYFYEEGNRKVVDESYYILKQQLNNDYIAEEVVI